MIPIRVRLRLAATSASIRATNPPFCHDIMKGPTDVNIRGPANQWVDLWVNESIKALHDSYVVNLIPDGSPSIKRTSTHTITAARA